jgi:hypothetical protein
MTLPAANADARPRSFPRRAGGPAAASVLAVTCPDGGGPGATVAVAHGSQQLHVTV